MTEIDVPTQSEFDTLQERVYDLERKIELLVSVVAYRGNNDVWLRQLADDVSVTLWHVAEKDFMEYTRGELKVEAREDGPYDVILTVALDQRWHRLRRSQKQFSAAFAQAAEASFVRKLRADVIKVRTVVAL